MNASAHLAAMSLGRPLSAEKVPVLSDKQFRSAILDGVAEGARVSALFGVAGPRPGEVDLFVLLADDEENRLHIGRRVTARGSFDSLTPDCPQVHYCQHFPRHHSL